MARSYEFFSTWHIPASPFEVLTVLSDETQLPMWWPSAFVLIRRTSLGDESGVGRTADVLARGFLPYTLRWNIQVTDILPDQRGFMVRVQGDLNGTGVWTAVAEEGGCALSLRWKVQVGRPLLRRMEWIVWPLFHANHHWAMHHGERSMCLEVRRRRGEINVPAPSSPITFNVVWRRLLRGRRLLA